MQPAPVVNFLQELTDAAACVFQTAIVSPVYLLLFQRAHESLCARVVVWIAAAAHADLNLVLLQQPGVIDRGILHASIGVMNEFLSLPIAATQGHLQRSNRQFSLQRSAQVPANHSPRVG